MIPKSNLSPVMMINRSERDVWEDRQHRDARTPGHSLVIYGMITGFVGMS